MSSGPDPLFDVKNAFYLGNWQQCLNEAHKVKTTDDDQKLLRDIFMYRAYIAQKKYGVVMNEIDSSKPDSLKAVKLLAKYFSQNPSSRYQIAEDIGENLGLYTADNISTLMAATIFYYEQDYESALKVLHNADDIECLAFSLQIYLKMDRLDLARKEYKKICAKDEYCTLSQLAQASMNLFVAGEKLQDAYFIFQELKEKYGPTPLLLNGQASCLISQGRFSEAEPLVEECIEKDANYSEAIINQMVLAQFNAKPIEQINRYINQLNDSGVNSTFFDDYTAKEKEFDKIAIQYQA